jgi:hypothetical protein
MRGKKKTWKQNLDDVDSRREYYERRIAKKPLASSCVKGRLKHTFVSPGTATAQPEDKCWWCAKTLAQVRAERQSARRKALP